MIQVKIFDEDMWKLDEEINRWLAGKQHDKSIKFELVDIKFVKSEDYKENYHRVRYCTMVVYDITDVETSRPLPEVVHDPT